MIRIGDDRHGDEGSIDPELVEKHVGDAGRALRAPDEPSGGIVLMSHDVADAVDLLDQLTPGVVYPPVADVVLGRSRPNVGDGDSDGWVPEGV